VVCKASICFLFVGKKQSKQPMDTPIFQCALVRSGLSTLQTFYEKSCEPFTPRIDKDIKRQQEHLC
jgi:hypothetical protein